MSATDDLERLLYTAEKLFYERGYGSVGMDALRADSGLALKRIYSLLPSKDAIAVAMLERRDVAWRGELAAFVDGVSGARERVLAVFAWLEEWLAGPGHRGCAWINAFGELGTESPAVAATVREHKGRVREYLDGLCAEAGCSPAVAAAVFLLAEGAMSTAGIEGSPAAAREARAAVELLLAG
ncbi:MAG: TetR/AcrR family transcriptional regulator [Arthrobacter sp.]|jgi:AcrR family transcriptional regulator|nr:TetR/AcrR family transcriptional regulator [Arthrobacter sp.]